MEAYIQLLIWIAGPAIVGLVVWVWSLWKVVNRLQLHISETYVKHNDLEDIKRDVRTITQVIFEIAGKVGVVIRRD